MDGMVIIGHRSSKSTFGTNKWCNWWLTRWPTINNLCPPSTICAHQAWLEKVWWWSWQRERRKRAAGGDRHRHQRQKSAKSATTKKTSIIRTISQQQSRKPVSLEPKVSKVTSQQTYKSPAVAGNSSCRSCVNNVHWRLCSTLQTLSSMTNHDRDNKKHFHATGH